MKITDVEAIILRQPVLDDGIADGSQDDLVIRVHTDEGIVGIGEVDSSPEMVKAAVYAPHSHTTASGLRELLIGEDPLDVERLWSKMYRGAIYYARRGAGIHAIGGVDIALWDIRGKFLGKPVSQLLGAPVRERVKAYASTLMPETPYEVEACVSKWLAAGFKAVKLGWGPLGQDPARDVELVRVARRAAGDEVDLLIDFGLGYGADVDAALRVAGELEQLGIFCLEEPFYPDELSAYARLADSCTTRVSSGEELSTRFEFQDLIEQGHVDIIQPDVSRCGGLTEAVRIAEMAAARGVPVMPHAWKSSILKAATVHLLAVAPQGLLMEYAVASTRINSRLCLPSFPLDDGYVKVPTDPGLGVELDWDVVTELRIDN